MVRIKGFEYRETVYGYENARKQGLDIEKTENRMVTIYSGKQCKDGFSYFIFVKKINIPEINSDKAIVS